MLALALRLALALLLALARALAGPKPTPQHQLNELKAEALQRTQMRQEERRAAKEAKQTAERQIQHIQGEMEKQTKQAHQCKIELQSKLKKQHEEVRTTHHHPTDHHSHSVSGSTPRVIPSSFSSSAAYPNRPVLTLAL